LGGGEGDLKTRERPYYSVRVGKHPEGVKLDLSTLRTLFKSFYEQFEERGFFQEAFGYWCVDAHSVSGTLGSDIPAVILLDIRKQNLWPVQERCLEYSEDDLFDVIEFLCEHVSKPTDGWYHSYGSCGDHFTAFARDEGRGEFRTHINRILSSYTDPYELLDNGDIVARADLGLEPLLLADLPSTDPQNINGRVSAAIAKFRRHRSSFEDRRDALRDLADVLEYLRRDLKAVLLKQDESDLFNIANNFGIRHHNSQQKTEYDKAIWYSWIFYFYLSTIHASVRLIEKAKREGNG
jgi:hypothetical protein